MTSTRPRITYWTPRILGILFALFISLFALDVFEQGASAWELVLALLIHLIPTALVVVALVVAWRWEPVGAILFAALGVLYIVMTWGNFEWTVYLFISGPLFVIAALFFVDWLYRRQRQPAI